MSARRSKPADEGHQPVPASAELVALAAAARPDWPTADVLEALAAARYGGLTWSRVLVGLVRLMADPHAVPRELVPDPWDPRLRHRPADPEQQRQRAAEVRAVMRTNRPSRPALEGGDER